MKRCLLASLAAFALAVHAAPIRLADVSPKARFDLQATWEHEGSRLGSPDRLSAVIARAPAVEVRLNTAAHMGKRGRIYIALPQQLPGMRAAEALRMSWQARGRMQSGSVLPGQRALLYDGPIESPLTSDILDVTIHTDARHMPGGLRVDPYFEFEPAP